MRDVVLFGTSSRETWSNRGLRHESSGKTRSHTKRGPGRMPVRRRPCG